MNRNKKKLEAWKFAIGETQDCLANAKMVTVPHTWNVEDGLYEYAGSGWYAYQLTMSKTVEGSRYWLEFGAVYHDAWVYVNGNLAGKHLHSGYTAFTVEITNYIFWGGTTMGITKTCRDKRLAWEFIKFATLSGEGAEVLREIGMFTTALQPYEDNPDLRNYYNDWFGEQNVGAYFLDVLLPEAYCRELSMQDGVIHDALNLINAALQQDRNMTAEDAETYLKSYLQEKLKGYQIE